MKKLIDMTGRKFGALKVIGYSHRNERGEHHWECQCVCGKKTVVRGSNLRYGAIISCGCDSSRALNLTRTSHTVRRGTDEKRKEATIHSAVMDWLYPRASSIGTSHV